MSSRQAQRPHRPESILYVAYSLLPVGDGSAGGAEQILSVTEAEIAARGLRTTVAACSGSRVAGELLATGMASPEPDRYEQREAEHDACVIREIWRRSAAGCPFDLVHDMSGSFWRHGAAITAPVLATLHLPRSFYPPMLFAEIAPNVFFNCVSESQARTFLDLPRYLGVVQNGVAIERFPLTDAKQDYLLWMGRICEEKGTHVAIQVALRTGRPLVLAGQVYPFSYHRQYYAREILPHLQNSQVTFVEHPLFAHKVELLRHAHALLVSSLAEETSSLVSLEAMACGTPVIGFRRGAIPEIVADGETGLIVETVGQMAAAVERVHEIDPLACRRRVAVHDSSRRMAGDYERLYEQLIRKSRRQEIRSRVA